MPPVRKSRKIAVMGFRAVGKSTITIQFCEGHYVDAYNPTIENTFHKVMRFNNEDFEVDIVDTAGQDEHSSFQPQYAIGIHGYIFVYSINSKFSYNLVQTLNDKVLNALGVDKVPRVLVGNKIDLENERQVPTQDAQALAAKWGCAFLECSAKQNINNLLIASLDKVFQTMLAEIEKSSSPAPPQSETCILL